MNNIDLFERAKQVIPGGVDSPVRAFRKVGGTPRFISQARGACLRDAEGKEYVDYVLSWGPMILGHGHPKVVEAIKAQADLFISLHVNAGFDKEASGYELYFPGFGGQEAARGASRGESAAIVRDMVRTKHLNEGVRFAQILQKRLDPVFPRMDRGLREAPVPVLQNLSIPAVVLEIGFSTNPGDRKKLQEESVQAAVAKAIAESIREFFQ